MQLVFNSAQGQYAKAFICNDSKLKSIELRSAEQSVQPILQLNGSFNLLELHFDMLESLPRDLTYTFVLADEKWQENTNLNAPQYLEGFPESNNIQYDFSINTKVGYIHYAIRFPEQDMYPKLSGNYLLQVHDDDNLLFQYPIFVTEQSVGLQPTLELSNGLDTRQTHHQLRFNINLPSSFPAAAAQEIEVAVLQNFGKYTALEGIKPDNFSSNQLSFGMYGNISMPALNEYRAFDDVDLNNRSIRVFKQDVKADTVEIDLYTDEALTRNDYLTLRDLNGRFYIANRLGFSSDTDADYCRVRFTYDSPFLPEKALVLDGKAFDFDTYTLQHLSEPNFYYRDVLLKQGFYNYRYAAVSSSGVNVQSQEGSYLQTENVYTIIVYRKAFGNRYTQILSIVNINSANKF